MYGKISDLIVGNLHLVVSLRNGVLQPPTFVRSALSPPAPASPAPAPQPSRLWPAGRGLARVGGARGRQRARARLIVCKVVGAAHLRALPTWPAPGETRSPGCPSSSQRLTGTRLRRPEETTTTTNGSTSRRNASGDQLID